MRNTRWIPLLLALYFVILLSIAPINILSLDTYYYWDWSRHLALSYYDGSPMIAYFIKLATLLFGTNLFALSSIGISVMAITTGLIYKSARFFLTREASWIAALSWLFSPLVTLDILKQTTYDTPLALFWTSTLYYTIKFIQTNHTKELYFIGISAGLMLLSKYTGIVLILALLIFLVITPYRSLFKTKHFYGATALTLIIFSPVLLWNYQNHWQSFTYQLTTHQLTHPVNPFYNAAKTFVTLFIPALNLMLLPPFLVRNNLLDKKHALIVTLCRIICMTCLCFYLYLASTSEIRSFWLTPYLISSSLLLGYGFTTFPYPKWIIALVIIYGLISLGTITNNTARFNIIKNKKLALYYLAEQLNSTYPHLPNTIFTSGWFEARPLFFLKNKPIIYTLDCGDAQNQYKLWSQGIYKKITDKTLKEAVFIDRYDRLSCLNKYFDHCERIPTDTYSFRAKKYGFIVYRCQNQ